MKTSMILCLALSVTAAIGAESSAITEAAIREKDKHTLVIGEGHTRKLEGGSMTVRVEGMFGNFNFDTAKHENHRNPDAVTMDYNESCKPDSDQALVQECLFPKIILKK